MKTIYFLLGKEENKIILYHDKLRLEYVNDKAFLDALGNAFSSMYKYKKTLINFYVVDLNLISKLIHENKTLVVNYKTENFKFKNILYSIKFTDPIYLKQRIIFKDYFNFFDKEINSLETKYENLVLLINAMHLKFNINVNKDRILSITSISSKIFRKFNRLEARSIKLLNEREDTYIRKAYYGGRTEIYEHISNDLHYYDVNSLYPFIMKNYKLPIGTPKYKKVINIKNFYGFCEVIIKTPDNITLPILPTRMEKNNVEMGTIYPTGVFTGVYFSEELKYAIKHGYEILEISGGYEFSSNIIFENFVTTLYDLRLNEKNVKMKSIYKKLMNGLYGKFASIYTEEKLLIESEVDDIVVRKTFNNVSISAAIAAYGRIYIHDYVTENNIRIAYWDTDAIFTKQLLVHNIGKALGNFRQVCFIRDVVFVAAKFYMYRIDNDFVFMFRGIRKSDYNLKNNANNLLSFLKQQVNILSDDPKCKNILLPLVNNKKNKIEELSFCFYNKRKHIKTETENYTIPWNIKIIKKHKK